MSEEIIENDFYTGTKEFESIYNRLISMVPVNDHREASCVIYGH